MILLILGLIDLLGSIFLFLSVFHFVIQVMITPVSIILLLKSLLSFSGKGFYAGFVDLSSATILLLAAASISLHYAIVVIIGSLLLIKSLQSIVSFFVN